MLWVRIPPGPPTWADGKGERGSGGLGGSVCDRSAVDDSVDGRAQCFSSSRAEGSETDGEDRLRHGSETVEGCNAVVVDPLVGPHGDAGRTRADRAGDGSHNNAVQNGNGLIARDDEHRSPLAIRGFQEPQIALSYHGSASVMAMALAMAKASSSDDWG